MEGAEPPEDGGRTVGAALRTTRRKLPHWEIGGATYFVTFRLFGRPGMPRPLSVRERAIVGESVRFWHPARWRVHCATIMPDHVHLLVTPQEIGRGRWESRSRLVHSVKSYTAHAINAYRGVHGDLWQHESFDRIVRDEQEFDATAHYILHNAVKSGLVADGWEYDGFWCDHDTFSYNSP